MEDKDFLISRLQEEIKSRDKDIHQAAVYGKQLYEENLQLSSKIEELNNQKELLEQKKHSVQLDLETKIQAVNSQTVETEWQKERADGFKEKFEINVKENEGLRKKIENLTKENQYLKKLSDDLTVENKTLTEKADILVRQIKNFEEQAEKSICEMDNNESQDLQAQLSTYMLNNKELQDALAQTQCDVENAKKNESHLLQLVRELEEAICEKSSEISAYHAEAKKAKEDMEELQAEIEALKFDQVDVNRRGNSVFAELDDRRHLVEREYKILRKKYDQFRKDYDENLKELNKARGQIAILQSRSSRDYQEAYIDKLEDSLSSARKEINDLINKLSKTLKSNSETGIGFSKRNEYDYLRLMLEQLQKKEKELADEVLSLTSKNAHVNEKLIQTQHLLYRSKEDLDSAKQEILKLKQTVNELERGISHSIPNEPQTFKPKIEVLDGFKPLSPSKENEILNKSKFDHFPDFDIIPGEIELGEDGYREIKPPRKSNRFKLQEFNQIKPENEENVAKVDSMKLVNKKSELIVATNSKEKLNDETKRLRPRVTSRSKIAADRKNENCAQQ